MSRIKHDDDEARLDVIANAVSYTHLLHRHIEKEDGVVYKYARNNLLQNTMSELDIECERLEKEASEQHLQDKYISLIAELEAKTEG